MKKEYLNTIVKHYEDCLDKHGDSHLGVDWPKEEDVNTRYKVMLDIINFFGCKPEQTNTLLDFGSGTGGLFQFMKNANMTCIEYSGLDISEKFIQLSKNKFPGTTFYQTDILDENSTLPDFDFIIMNGVFTEKRELTFETMWDYFTQMLTKVFKHARKGVAFNVMSKAVSWEREDLFHLPADILINFLTKELTRNFIIRNDYGLFEYTTYIYK